MTIKNLDFDNLSEEYLKSFKKPDTHELLTIQEKISILNENFLDFGLNNSSKSSSCFNTLYNITINEQSNNFDNILAYMQNISKIDFIFLEKLNSFLLKIPIIDYWMDRFLNKFKFTIESVFLSLNNIEKLIDNEFYTIEQNITDIKDIKECFNYSIRDLELDLFALYFKQKESFDDNYFLEQIQSKIYSINLSRINLTQALTQVILMEQRIHNLRNHLFTLKNATLPIWKNTFIIIKNINKNLSSKFIVVENINKDSIQSISEIIIDNFNHNFINPYLINTTSNIVEKQVQQIKEEKNENYKINVDFFQKNDIIYKLK